MEPSSGSLLTKTSADSNHGLHIHFPSIMQTTRLWRLDDAVTDSSDC